MNLAYRHNKKQRGMTALSWVALLALVGVFVVVIIRLTPVYMEYYTIVSSLNNLAKDPQMKGMTKPVIMDSFRKRLNINAVESLTKNDYSVKKIKGKNSYLVEVDYVVLKPLFGNVSLHVAFQNSVEVGE